MGVSLEVKLRYGLNIVDNQRANPQGLDNARAQRDAVAAVKASAKRRALKA